MKFLILAQDLRVSGTSEGIVSRSFVVGLRQLYKKSYIKVVYCKHSVTNDMLDLLPVNSLEIIPIKVNVPGYVKWINKPFWRIKHRSLNEEFLFAEYRKKIAAIDFKDFDHIFIRSSGLQYETLLGAKDLPILKKAIVNFHDPYPVFWDTGSATKPDGLELFRLKRMWEVVRQSKGCITPASYLSQDMEFLYGTTKPFKTVPHHFQPSAFDLSDASLVRKKQKKICISYHGAVQFGRNIDILLDAYSELLQENNDIATNTEMVLRLRGSHNKRLIAKYNAPNISILDCLDFSNSSNEQRTQGDIFIILENCAPHSNILVGKAPFLASLQKPVLSLSPQKSEMRRIITEQKYIADCNSKNEIKEKLKHLIQNYNKAPVFPFGDYFELPALKKFLEEVIH